MDSKPSYAFEGHETKVEELKTYLYWSKLLFLFTLATFITNTILTYGLIFYPTKPNATTCAQFCHQVELEPRIADISIAAEPSTYNEMANKDFSLVSRDDSTKEMVVHTARDQGATYASAQPPSGLAERADFKNVKTAVTLAMGAYWTANQGVAWWNMISACRDWTTTSGTINCVWGSITTVITAAGSGYAAYIGAGKLSTWMNNNGITIGGGWKREAVDQDLLDGLSEWFGNNVTHLGVWDYSHLNLSGTLSMRNSTAPLDVFGVQSASGHPIHFSYLGNGNGKPTFKFGLGSGTSSTNTANTTNTTLSGREVFDQQYFTSGGLDFILDPNPEDSGTLDTYGDYW